MESPPLAEVAVQLTNVVKRFGDLTAVDDVDLTVKDGEFFSLLGPSGCGKTTTLRLIAGFEYPTEGSIAIHGKEMRLDPPDRRPVNTVFQSYALFPHMTVAENVGFGLLMKKVPKDDIAARVTRSLDMVQLTHRADARPDQMSGGQQQRVALARALVNEPEVLLLDEPLGALDLKLRQAMQIELKELQERVGITFIYVTHDQEEALTMSDRIGVMSAGKLLQVDAPQAIYENPTSRFVADFIGEINLLQGRVGRDRAVTLTGGQAIDLHTEADAGTTVSVALRPERLGIAAGDEPVPDGANRIEGTVRRRVYFGDSYYYEVDTQAGVIHVKQENRPGIALVEPGTVVTVYWNPRAAAVLVD